MQVENTKVAAAGKEAELNSKLEDHAHEVKDRNALNEKVLQLQRELEIAQTAIAEQVSYWLQHFILLGFFTVIPYKIMVDQLLFNILTRRKLIAFCALMKSCFLL